MVSRLRSVLLFFVLLLVFYLPASIFACSSSPDSIRVFSGGIYAGDGLSSNVYARSNLPVYPLRIELVYNSMESSCFNSASDASIRYFPSGSSVFANNLAVVELVNSSFNYEHIFSFSFASSFSGVSSISPAYRVGSHTGSLNVIFDDLAPQITLLEISPQKEVYSQNDRVRVLLRARDLGIGISSLNFAGLASLTRNYNFVSEIEEEVSFNLSQSGKLFLSISDGLSQIYLRELDFFVDTRPPSISDLSAEYHYGVSQEVSFSVRVSDESFLHTNRVPVVRGDFSAINPSLSSVSSNCQRFSDNAYTCRFPRMSSNFNSTQTISLSFEAVDLAGNVGERSFSHQLFVDRNPPRIDVFELRNGLGVSNVFSAYDDNVSVVLRFEDASIERGLRPEIIGRFGNIALAPEPECRYAGRVGECVFELGSRVLVYSNMAGGNTTFQIAVIDPFSNIAREDISVQVDNSPPKILSVAHRRASQGTSLDVLRSGDEVIFTILTEGFGMFSNEYFVYADFSGIDYREGSSRAIADCIPLNASVNRCEFRGVILENGYINTSVLFSVYNAAGNLVEVEYPVEVLRVSSEQRASFQIADIEITAPLNRNLFIRNSARINAWFEGEIVRRPGNDDMMLINYQLRECSLGDLNPLRVRGQGLYPDSLVSHSGNVWRDDFALRIQLHPHENANDLNTKRMECSMAVLKRDAQDIYPAEIVNFTVVFSFFDLPRDGNLVRANAQKILDMTYEIDYLGGNFDTIYKIYNIFNTACGIFGGGVGIISSVNNAYMNFRFAQQAFTAGGGEVILQPVDSKLINLQGSFSSLFSDDGPIKKMCDFVTCRGGGPLTGLLMDQLDDVSGGGFSQVSDLFTQVCSSPVGIFGGGFD